MISNHHLEHLLSHNFIDIFTRDELVRMSEPHSNKWSLLSNNLKDIISEIEKYELDHPLGMNGSSPFWTICGTWDYELKEFTFTNHPDDKFSLEDLRFYYKLLTFLKVIDIQ